MGEILHSLGEIFGKIGKWTDKHWIPIAFGMIAETLLIKKHLTYADVVNLYAENQPVLRV